jgi:hypothetical protein
LIPPQLSQQWVATSTATPIVMVTLAVCAIAYTYAVCGTRVCRIACWACHARRRGVVEGLVQRLAASETERD